MAVQTYTEFCCRSGGDNLNAGTRTGSSTEPGTAADFTYASGNWVAATGVFTVASGNPSSDGVAVGDCASVYTNGSTVTGFIGWVTARDATTITVSLVRCMGTPPADGTGNRTLKIGGAWLGPTTGVTSFPFLTTFLTGAATNAAANPVRINVKNDRTHTFSTALSHSNGGYSVEGYTTVYSDKGRATFSTSSAIQGLILTNPSSADEFAYSYLNFVSTASSGTNAGITVNSGADRARFFRVSVSGFRGSGWICNSGQAILIECEAIGNCTSGSANQAGIDLASSGGRCQRCISRNNAGAGHGFRGSATVVLVDCISAGNPGDGYHQTGTNHTVDFYGCDFYDNDGAGIRIEHSGTTTHYTIVNCNFVKNGTYGINNVGTGIKRLVLLGCSFGSGTMANVSGNINPATEIQIEIEEGTVTYAADVTPWVDPNNGDFRVNLAAAKGTGRGDFLQAAGTLTVGYPDRGAAQHADPTVTPNAVAKRYARSIIGDELYVRNAGANGITSQQMAPLNTGWCARFTAPDTRDVAGFWVNWTGVTAPGTVEFRIETIDGTTGKPSGTLYDPNATVSLTPVVGWQNGTFATLPTTGLVAGNEYGLVAITTVAGTAQGLRYMTGTSWGVNPTITLTAADGSTRSNFGESIASAPVASIVFEDGTEDVLSMCPYATPGSYSIFGTNAAGGKFTVPTGLSFSVSEIEVTAAQKTGTPAGDIRVRVFNSVGSVVAGTTVTIDKDSLSTLSSIRGLRFRFPAPVLLTNGIYRAVIDSASSANSSNCWSLKSGVARTSATAVGGIVMTSTADITAGTVAWTDTTSEVPCVNLILDDIPGQVIGSGGGGVNRGRIVNAGGI